MAELVLALSYLVLSCLVVVARREERDGVSCV